MDWETGLYLLIGALIACARLFQIKKMTWWDFAGAICFALIWPAALAQGYWRPKVIEKK